MSTPYQHELFDRLRVKLPRHWEETALKYISLPHSQAFVDGPFGSDLKSDEYVDDGIPLIQLNNIRDGQHVLRNIKFITENKKAVLSRHIARPGDLVFAKMAEPVARTALVSAAFEEYVVVADCVKMSADEQLVDTGYLVWAINSDCVRITAELVSTGTTRIRISLGELKRLRVPFPPLAEQTQIAKFLDYETAKIDALISKQQQLIALLKEKRQAVISHAVTKGLNPDAAMRHSGVEWLCDVPAHWKVVKLKHLVELPIIDGPHETPAKYEQGVPFISAEAISDGYINFDKKWGYISHEDDLRYKKRYVAKKGDILMVKLGATTGTVAVVDTDDDFNIWVPLAVIRCNEDVDKNFILNVLRSRNLVNAYEVNWTYGTQQTLGLRTIENLYIPLPPSDEQKTIAIKLNDHVTRLELLWKKAVDVIDVMKERRSALISAAVTGKIDVRGWKAPQTALEAEVA